MNDNNGIDVNAPGLAADVHGVTERMAEIEPRTPSPAHHRIGFANAAWLTYRDGAPYLLPLALLLLAMAAWVNLEQYIKIRHLRHECKEALEGRVVP